MARTFDGVDDVVEVTASSSLETPTTALTAAILFRPSSTVESFGGLFYKTNDAANSWAILIDSNTVMNFYAELQSGTGVTAQVNESLMTVGTYYWLVLRWSSGSQMSLRVYNMDGSTNQTVTSAGTVTHTITYGGSARQLRFAQNEGTGNLGGDIAAAGVFSSSLSDADVTTLMGSPAGMASLSPVASWLFDQDSIATPVPDETGNGADQSAITGTTVATFPVPGGYGVAPAVGGVMPWLRPVRQFIHPRALLLFHPPWADAAVTAAATDAPAEATAAIGAAFDATVDITVNAGNAAATGVAADTSIAITVNAETTSATGAAFDATVSTLAATNAPAELTTATGVTNDATVAITVNAEVATATGAAFEAQVGAGAQAETTTSTGAANAATVDVTVNAGATTATGTAFDATVSVSGDTSAPAGATIGTGIANDATASIAVNAETTTGTGAAFNATVTIGREAPAGTTTATGAAFDASIAITVNAENAIAVGVAFDVPLAAQPDDSPATTTILSGRYTTTVRSGRYTNTVFWGESTTTVREQH